MKKRGMVITVTGLIGAGKTTLASFFRDKGANVINVDYLGQKILQGAAKKDIVKAFGAGILRKDSKIDPKKLAGIVFRTKKDLHKLHTITHPYIKKAIRKKLSKKRVNVVDAALYRDFDLHKISDYTILVKASIATRAKHLAGVHSEAEILKRQRFQSEPKKVDLIVWNNKHVLNLKREAEKIWAMLVS